MLISLVSRVYIVSVTYFDCLAKIVLVSFLTVKLFFFPPFLSFSASLFSLPGCLQAACGAGWPGSHYERLTLKKEWRVVFHLYIDYLEFLGDLSLLFI